MTEALSPTGRKEGRPVAGADPPRPPSTGRFDPVALVGGRIDRYAPGRISYTRISAYQRCPARFKYQYLDELPIAASGAALAGQAGHEVIEAMVREDWFSNPFDVDMLGHERFVAIFDQKIEEAGGMSSIEWSGRQRVVEDEQGKKVQAVDPHTGDKLYKISPTTGRKYPIWEKSNEDYYWWCRMGPVMMKRAGTILRQDVENGCVIEAANVERNVAAWLDGPGSDIVSGIIDLMLLVTGDGEEMVRDWKLGGHMSMEPMQLANYAWLLRSTEREEDRIYVDIGEFIYLRGGQKEDWRKPHDLRSLIPLVPTLYREAMYGMKGGFFPLRPSSFCSACWVREHCPYGSTLGDN